jgi:hypothetical protein
VTATPSRQLATIDAVTVFRARCEARAQLWFNGALSLHDAVDELWHDAERDGLVAKLGADEVQRIVADAFAPLRDDLAGDAANIFEPIDEADDDTFAAACRKADDKQRGKLIDPRIARVRRWLDDDASIERVYVEAKQQPGAAIATIAAAEHLIRLGDLERWRKWLSKHSAQEREAILQHLERQRGKK